VSGAEAVSGVEFVDLLFTGFDEGINGGPITSGQGSEDGSVNDPFVGFGGGGGVEGGKVFQRLFELGFGLGGVAIFLCGWGAGSIYVVSVGCLSVYGHGRRRGRRRGDDLGLLRRLCRLLRGGRRLRRLGLRWRSGQWRGRGSNSGRGRRRRWGNSGRGGTFGLGDGVDGQAHERTLKFGRGSVPAWEESSRTRRAKGSSSTGGAWRVAAS
jgi:hypothetical protein